MFKAKKPNSDVSLPVGGEVISHMYIFYIFTCFKLYPYLLVGRLFRTSTTLSDRTFIGQRSLSEAEVKVVILSLQDATKSRRSVSPMPTLIGIQK